MTRDPGPKGWPPVQRPPTTAPRVGSSSPPARNIQEPPWLAFPSFFGASIVRNKIEPWIVMKPEKGSTVLIVLFILPWFWSRQSLRAIHQNEGLFWNHLNQQLDPLRNIRISLGSDLHNILLHHCQNRHDHVAVMEEVKMLTWNTHTQKTVLVHCPESLNKCSDSHVFFFNVFDKCCPSHEKNPHQLIHPPFFRC